MKSDDAQVGVHLWGQHALRLPEKFSTTVRKFKAETNVTLVVLSTYW
jgi:hypothetical protein